VCSSDSGRREQPLFTLRQVGVICEGMLHEREVRIRQQYDQILSAKLAGEHLLRNSCIPALLVPSAQTTMLKMGKGIPERFLMALFVKSRRTC